MATLANFSLTVQNRTKIIIISGTVAHVCINSNTLYTHKKMNHAMNYWNSLNAWYIYINGYIFWEFSLAEIVFVSGEYSIRVVKMTGLHKLHTFSDSILKKGGFNNQKFYIALVMHYNYAIGLN